MYIYIYIRIYVQKVGVRGRSGFWGFAQMEHNALQHTATHYNTPHKKSIRCITLQHIATLCNFLHVAETRCNLRTGFFVSVGAVAVGFLLKWNTLSAGRNCIYVFMYVGMDIYM